MTRSWSRRVIGTIKREVGKHPYLSDIVVDMELRHLRYFLAVGEEGNISRAAKRLHVSQPPLSRQIRDLEGELGFALFRRSARSIELTIAGRVFLTEARAALQRVDDAIATARAAANRKRDSLSVGHTSTLAIELIPRTLRIFQRSHSNAKIELRTLSTLQMIRALNEGELDLAITVHGNPAEFQGLNVRKIGSCKFKIAVHNQHRFSRMRKVPVRELATERIISLPPSRYPWYSRFVYSVISPRDGDPPLVEEHDNAQSLIAAVEAERGVAIVYAVMAKTLHKRVTLRPLMPEPPDQPILVLSRDETTNPLIRKFVVAAKAAALM